MKITIRLAEKSEKENIETLRQFPYNRYSCQTVKQSTWICCTKKCSLYIRGTPKRTKGIH